MRDVINEIDSWLQSETPVVMATVLETWGSAPRQVGAKMAMTTEGLITGSVSGGCVEGAVFETGVEVLVTRVPQLLSFGVADETAWDVGLACGGSIEVFVEPLDPLTYSFVRELLDENESFATVTVTGGPESLIGKKLVVQRGGRVFGQISEEVDGIAAVAGRANLATGESARQTVDILDYDVKPLELFIEVLQPAPTLVTIGGVHIAIALTSIAQNLGYQTIVIDPRRAFGNKERFPQVDRLIQSWPQEAFDEYQITSSTAIASLTHDPKIDDPALRIALASPAFYVGALGSKSTHARRRARLLASGISEERLDFIHGPIGLDIGARSPEEIALSIMAEIVAARNNL